VRIGRPTSSLHKAHNSDGNVSVTPVYAMSHLSAVNLAGTHGLAGCRPTRGTLAARRGTGISACSSNIYNGLALDGPARRV